MKLYIKQKVFALTDKYNVYDEQGNIYYKVERGFMGLTAKLHLYDLAGNELYYIHRKLTMMLARYEIFKGNQLCAIVQQKFQIGDSRRFQSSIFYSFGYCN